MAHPKIRQRLAAILVADVAGYSRLMEQDERATVATLNEHRTVFRKRIKANGGRVVDMAGDSVLAVFDSAIGAATAAIYVQAEIAKRNEALPEERRMLFRIGVNLGDIIEQADGAVYGDGVNVAARLQAMADPGGIYASGSVYDSVRSKLGLPFDFLGEQRVKNIVDPVRTFRIVLPGTSVPRRVVGLTGDIGNLPHQATNFVGRTHELDAVFATLDRARCVTLAGVGGAGKTRLALEAAERKARNYSDGAWLCELAPVKVPDAIGHALASALRIEQRSGLSVEDSLIEVLRGRHQLLVIDNCEHVLERAAALVASILRGCPKVTVLATSREPLAIDGENVIPVPPLEVPAEAANLLLEDIAKSDSVTLLVDRARSVHPDFALTTDNCQAIAEICRRLDGVPLAIELAAARVRSMTPADIARRLKESFRLLTGGKRTAVPRHQTLRATIDWSYGLLTDAERALFQRLSVFVGGLGLEAAETVCSGGNVQADQVLDILASLVDKSIVLPDETGESIRYRLLETFRQYGDELIDAPARDALKRLHAQYFVALAERGEPQIRGPDERAWVNRFDAEFDNFRAAHAWAVSKEETDLALRLAACLPLYAIFRLRLEPTAWAQAAIELRGAAAHRLAPYVAGYAAWGVWITGGFARAKEYGLRALTWEKSIGTQPTWLPRHALMCLCFNEANMPEALRLVNEGLTISRAEGDVVRVAHNLMAKSVYLHSLADEGQLEMAQESERLARQGDNPAMIALSCYAMAVALAASDPNRAMGYIDESLAVARPIRYRWAIATALTLQCTLRAQYGEPIEALLSVREAIALWHGAGDWASQWRTLRCAIAPLAKLRAYEAAATVQGTTTNKTFMGEFPAGFDGELAKALDAAERALGEKSFSAATAHGAGLSDAGAIAHALGAIGKLMSESYPFAGET